MAKEDLSSYRNIFKATSLFGGVQVYQILIEIIKSKIIAVLLGPVGVGITGLYSSGIMMVQQLSSLGLSSSAVRNVAEAYGSNDTENIRRTYSALNNLVLLTGLIGMSAVVLLSPILSQLSFGDNMHIWGFIALSIIILFIQISNGQRVILQGTRKYKYLAKSSAYGVTIGLFISVPLYYKFGVDGIVPNLIIGYLTTLLLSYYFAHKISIKKIKLTITETFSIGKSMLIMGITMCLTGFLPMASSYILRFSIRMWDGIETVGLFSAGFMLMTQYTNLVFNAMSTDFYPRLAAVNQDNEKCREIMNHQGEIGVLLLGPLMVLCVAFIPIVIKILFSDSFLEINNFIIWSAMGMIFKIGSWTVSHIILAKAESKLFAFNEVSACVYGLCFDLLFFYLWGLSGLGLSFSAKFLIYMLQVYIIANMRYNFSFSKSFLKLFFVELFLVGMAIIGILLLPSNFRYVYGILISIICITYSIVELDKRMGIKTAIKNIKRR